MLERSAFAAEELHVARAARHGTCRVGLIGGAAFVRSICQRAKRAVHHRHAGVRALPLLGRATILTDYPALTIANGSGELTRTAWIELDGAQLARLLVYARIFTTRFGCLLGGQWKFAAHSERLVDADAIPATAILFEDREAVLALDASIFHAVAVTVIELGAFGTARVRSCHERAIRSELVLGTSDAADLVAHEEAKPALEPVELVAGMT